ncbi:MAG TPA: protein kinase, partial [bacterium]
DWYTGRAMEMVEDEERKMWEDARYLSPEQVHRIGELTIAADMYSLGIVLYHMLTGFPVFHDPDESKVRYQQVYVDATPHIDYYRQIPTVVKEILITALHKDPSMRFPSMVEFKEAVAYALAAVSFKRAKRTGSLAGQVIDNAYEIMDEMGTGQFTSIYKALEKGRDKFVTLKFYDEKLSREEGFVRAINKDLYTRAQLKHPHVVDFIAQGWHANQYYIVESYVPSSLSTILEDRGKLTSEMALRIIRKIVAILEYLNTKGVMTCHGELKPEHILINPAGDDVYIKDFRLPETNKFIHENFGVPPSAYPYMAPEILVDDPESPPDQRADIYSLGLLLYRLVAGETLFNGTPEEVMNAHLEDDAAPRIQDRYEIPLVFHDILIKSLEKNPGDRYQTFAELSEDIDHLLGGSNDQGINIQLIDQGTTIKGKFRLEERMADIGGEHGPSPGKDLVIYNATHVTTDTPVMVWFYRIPKTNQLDADWGERLKAYEDWEHPNILRILDHGRDKGAYFFVSELRHHTAADYVAEHGPMSESDAVKLGQNIADGLKFLKAQGVDYFGRISPESIFVVSSPKLRAKLTGLERDIFYDSSSKLNRAEYLSPEQVTGIGDLTTASDVYSWGLLLYYLVTGKDLIHGEPHQIAGLHVYHDPSSDLDTAPITKDLRRIIERALKKDFTSRYSSWNEVLEDLEDYHANVVARETEDVNLSFIPGSASYYSVMEVSDDLPEDEFPAEEVKTMYAMRYPLLSIGVRGSFAVASGVGPPADAARCANLALNEAEQVFSYSSLSRLDLLDDPGQLGVSAFQRANGVVNQEAFRLNKIGTIGAEMVVAYILKNRLYLARAGSGFAYMLRAGTIRTFLRSTREKSMIGKELTITPDMTERHMRTGDVLIIGSSELGRVLSEVEIRNCVTSTIDSQDAAERIITLASSRFKGTRATESKEGMSCVVVQFGEVMDTAKFSPGSFPAAPVIHHYVTKGSQLLEEGMVDKALTELTKALEIKPDSFSVNFQLAQAYRLKGQLELAIKHCRKSLDLFPGFADGHIRMGDILYERGNIDKSREEYEMAVAAAPNSPSVYNALGAYYFREALFTLAIRAFKRALEMDPLNEKAKNSLEVSQKRARSITGAMAETTSKVKHGIRRPFSQRGKSGKVKKRK